MGQIRLHVRIFHKKTPRGIQIMIRLSFGFCALRLCKKSAGQPGLPSFLPQSVSSLACSAKSVYPVPTGHARRFCPAKNLIVGKLTRLTAPSASERLLSWRREIVHCFATILTSLMLIMIKYIFHFIITAFVQTSKAPRPRPYWECHETLQGDCN